MDLSSLTKAFTIMIIIGLSLSGLSCGPGTTSDGKTKGSTVQESIPEKSRPEEKKKVILFFGNSLTAGYQLEEEESFPSLIQEKIYSSDLPYTVINAGLSGETSAGGLGRIDWVLKQDIDLFVLELGPNDALRGLDLNETIKNLRGICQRVKDKNPEIPIVIAGMIAPPNMGKTFTDKFAGIYTDLAKEFDAGLIPFLLEGVAGIPDLNLRDGIHPNAEGQKIVAENVWKILEGYL